LKVHGKKEKRHKRHRRVRVKISGTKARPRLAVFISNKNIYLQIIDDVVGNTLVSASTLEKNQDFAAGTTVPVAEKLGELLAKRAIDKGISKVVFDRGGFQYHGRVKAVAESARKCGLVL